MPLSRRGLPFDTTLLPHVQCAYCSQVFDDSPQNPGPPADRPYFLPVRRMAGGGFEVAHGVFCSPGCVLARLYEPYVQGQTPEGVAMLRAILTAWGFPADQPIPRAPDFMLLHAKGGPMALDEFRAIAGFGGLPPVYPTMAACRSPPYLFVESECVTVETRGQNDASQPAAFLEWIGKVASEAAATPAAPEEVDDSTPRTTLRKGMEGLEATQGVPTLLQILREEEEAAAAAAAAPADAGGVEESKSDPPPDSDGDSGHDSDQAMSHPKRGRPPGARNRPRTSQLRPKRKPTRARPSTLVDLLSRKARSKPPLPASL